MNPSPQAVAAIRATQPDWTADDAAIAAGLNEPAGDNPEPQATRPKPFTKEQVFGLLSPASAGKLVNVAFLPDIRNAIQVNDRGACAMYAKVLRAGDVITDEEFTALAGLLQEAEPDPGYRPQISWAEATLGRPVDEADIRAARPGV